MKFEKISKELYQFYFIQYNTCSNEFYPPEYNILGIKRLTRLAIEHASIEES